MKVDLPFTTAFGAGNMPAFSNAVVFGEIMQAGMVLLGKGAPCTMPAGRTPPGQFRARTALDIDRCIGDIANIDGRLRCNRGQREGYGASAREDWREGYGSSRNEEWRDAQRARCWHILDPYERDRCWYGR